MTHGEPGSGASPLPASPDEVIGKAIQDIMAARLGSGLIPLAILVAVGTVDFARGGGPGLAVGALLASAAMLAYGLRIVQRAFGRPARNWMMVAQFGSVVPPIFSVYVFGWLGLRGFAQGGGASAVGMATLLAGLGVWLLRRWMQVVEVERLARAMAMNTD